MSEQERTGGPAFPVKNQTPLGELTMAPGMTLLDYFAGQALQGMLASGQWPTSPKATMVGPAVEAAYELGYAMVRTKGRFFSDE